MSYKPVGILRFGEIALLMALALLPVASARAVARELSPRNRS